jgi:hypothetical protein
MNGIVILTSNYTYEGSIFNKEPHGKGIFYYANGDKYIGSCKFGKPDGFGTYYFSKGGMYTGFFSFGKINGIGTYEDGKNVYKGTWRNDKKHGTFLKTSKKHEVSYQQLWIKGKKVDNKQIQYVQPLSLATTKENPVRKPKVYQTAYKGREKKCVVCLEQHTNATNDRCGHVALCYDCLLKCDKCPICRCSMGKVVRLFTS